MTAITATLTQQKWGPERWQMFDYWANPIRDPTGNPVLVWRHGGGGWQNGWLVIANGVIEWPILQAPLLENLGAGKHFDIISVNTCQQFVSGINAAIYRRSTRHNMYDNVQDMKRAICALKFWGAQPTTTIDFVNATVTDNGASATDVAITELVGVSSGATSVLIGNAQVTITSVTGNVVLGTYQVSGHSLSSTVQIAAAAATGNGTASGYITIPASFGVLGGRLGRRIDPNLFTAGGDSFGATVTSLAQITPPLVYQTEWNVGAKRTYAPEQYDSTVNAVVFHRGQVDFRSRSLPDSGGTYATRNYLDHTSVGGIWGTVDDDSDSGAEWALVSARFKEYCSLLAYIENGYTDHYKPMFTIYGDDPAQTGAHPLMDNHDKKMRLDLNNALTMAGLDFETALSPIGPQSGGTDYSPEPFTVNRVYSFLAHYNAVANNPAWSPTL